MMEALPYDRVVLATNSAHSNTRSSTRTCGYLISFIMLLLLFHTTTRVVYAHGEMCFVVNQGACAPAGRCSSVLIIPFPRASPGLD